MNFLAFVLIGLLLVAFVLIFLAWSFFKKQQRRGGSLPTILVHQDEVLGQCSVELPDEKQASNGLVSCEMEVNGNLVEMTACFSSSDSQETGINNAITELRLFHRLASDSQLQKKFKNVAASHCDIHNELFPDKKMTEGKLKNLLKFSSIFVLSDTQAWFRYSSLEFMQGRPIYVTVDDKGDVESSGVG